MGCMDSISRIFSRKSKRGYKVRVTQSDTMLVAAAVATDLAILSRSDQPQEDFSPTPKLSLGERPTDASPRTTLAMSIDEMPELYVADKISSSNSSRAKTSSDSSYGQTYKERSSFNFYCGTESSSAHAEPFKVLTSSVEVDSTYIEAPKIDHHFPVFFRVANARRRRKKKTQQHRPQLSRD